MYTGDGGGIDRPCMEPQRGAVLPGTAVASAADDLKQDTVEHWGVKRLSAFRDRPTGASKG